MSAWPSRRPSARFWILALLTALVALGGGSRASVPSLLVIRPACILLTAALIVAPGSWEWPRYRPLVWLLSAWALMIATQLVPLPPALFAALPGRGALVQAAMVAGRSQPWRPLSLAPDLTLDSLLTLLVPVAVLVAFAGFGRDDRARTPFLVLGIAAASALLAVLQLVGGQESAAYFYQSTSVTLPVGLLANRNHQAALMAIGITVLVWWHLNGGVRRSSITATVPVMLAGAAFGLVGLMTGSRSGVLLMGVALVLGFIAGGGRRRVRKTRGGLLGVGAVCLGIACIIAAALILGRATAVNRLGDPDGITNDLRFRAFPVMMQIAHIYAPFGTGFGTFDPVFRIHEPDALLRLFYFNNAHDDFLEVLITGGVPAVTLLFAALMWIGIRAGNLLTTPIGRADAESSRGRLGLAVLVLLAAASLSDYPLRTPLMQLVGTIALCWVATPRRTVALVSPESLG